MILEVWEAGTERANVVTGIFKNKRTKSAAKLHQSKRKYTLLQCVK
jgi:hypothetical protein